MDERLILEYVHHLYHDLGVQDLTVQTDFAWVSLEVDIMYSFDFTHI